MISGLALVALLLAAGTSDRTGIVGVVALVALSLLWLIVNGPMEGDVIATVAPSHGLTAADLAGLAGLALAAWRFRTWRLARGR